MAAMTAPDRAKFLNQVLGYERLRAAEDVAKDRRRDVVNTMAGLRAGMSDAQAVAAALADSERRLAEARARLREAERRTRRAEAALADVAPRWEAAQRE